MSNRNPTFGHFVNPFIDLGQGYLWLAGQLRTSHYTAERTVGW